MYTCIEIYGHHGGVSREGKGEEPGESNDDRASGASYPSAPGVGLFGGRGLYRPTVYHYQGVNALNVELPVTAVWVRLCGLAGQVSHTIAT